MKNRRALSKAVLAVSALLAIPTAAQASGNSHPPAAQAGSDKVIVVLKSQFAGLPDTPGGAARRSAVVAASQRGVIAELTAAHARAVKPISLVNAVAATVSPAVASRLATNPAVAEVVPDQRIAYGSPAPAHRARRAPRGRSSRCRAPARRIRTPCNSTPRRSRRSTPPPRPARATRRRRSATPARA